MNAEHAALMRELFFTFSLTTPRMLVMLTVLPIMGPDLLPRPVRNSLAISFALVLFPTVHASMPAQPPTGLEVTVILLKETLIGFLLGYLAAMFFWAMEGAGNLIDNQRGASMGMIMDPLSGLQTTPTGSMALQLVGVLFFTSGGFLMLMGGVFTSYQMWPVSSFFPKIGSHTALLFLELTGRMVAAIVVLASPAIIAMFLVTLGMGLINRFAPKLNVFILSMPIKSVVGIFIIIIYLYGAQHHFTDFMGLFETGIKRLGEVFHE